MSQIKTHQILAKAIPPHIKEDYPIFYNFLRYYYQWLDTRKYLSLEDISNIDYTNQAISLIPLEQFETNDEGEKVSIKKPRPIDDWLGYTIVGENGARAEVVAKENGKLIIRYLTKDARIERGTQVYIKRDLNNSITDTKLLDLAYVDNIETMPSLFIDEFSKMLDVNQLFTQNQDAIALILKNIKHLYTSKGTEEALRYLLKASQGVDSEVTYPYENVLRPSDAKWEQLVAITVKTIEGDVPDNISSIRIYDNAETVTVNGTTSSTKKYKDYSVSSIERFPHNGIIRFYLNRTPDFVGMPPYKVDYFADDGSQDYYGEIVDNISRVKVVNGGKGWQVGQIFIVYEQNGWFVNNYSYDNELFPWSYRHSRDEQDLDYGQHGISTEVRPKVKPTICKVTVVDEITGAIKHAEIIQLGDYVAPTKNNYITVSPLFFEEGTAEEAEYYATLEFDFGQSTKMPGRWFNDSGQVSNQNIVLQDSYYYQQFSYDIVTTVNSMFYEHLAKSMHPAGTKMFTTYVAENDLDASLTYDVDITSPYIDQSIYDMAYVLEKSMDGKTGIQKYMTKPLADEITVTWQMEDTDGNLQEFGQKVTKDISKSVRDYLFVTTNDIIRRMVKYREDKVHTEESFGVSFTRVLGSSGKEDCAKPTDLGMDKNFLKTIYENYEEKKTDNVITTETTAKTLCSKLKDYVFPMDGSTFRPWLGYDKIWDNPEDPYFYRSSMDDISEQYGSNARTVNISIA